MWGVVYVTCQRDTRPLRSHAADGPGGKGKSVQEDSVLAETSQVPSVEKVMQFDVVRRVGTEMSGIPLDPADVERECENLSDDEEGVEVETENSVVVID